MSIFKPKPLPKRSVRRRPEPSTAQPQALGSSQILSQIQEAADQLAQTRAKLLALVEGNKSDPRSE